MIVRKKNRLPYKEIYQSNNSFFVTVCVEGRLCCLSEISNGQASLAPTGEIVQNSWLSLPGLVNNIQLDDFVIMPNHFHGIITFLDTPTFKNSGNTVDLFQILAMFKSKTTNLIRRGMPLASLSSQIPMPLASQNNQNGQASLAPTMFQWQKSFYDHVIRGEKDLQRIQEYIFNNPLKWELDILNPKNNQQFETWRNNKNGNIQNGDTVVLKNGDTVFSNNIDGDTVVASTTKLIKSHV